MFQRIKRELFFLHQLFSRRFPASYYFNYFKYRFFGDYLLARLPRHSCEIDQGLSVHMMCQESDVGMVEWSIRSFLRHSGLCPRVIVHEDGSMTKKSAERLESRFSNVSVLFKDEANRILKAHPLYTKTIERFHLNGHKVMIQLLDIYLLSDTRKVMLLDGDVLFFKRPNEVIDFVQDKLPYDAMISKQYGTYDLRVKKDYEEKHRLIERLGGLMNPGLILINKSSITPEMFFEFFENTERDPGDYFLPMSGWSSLIPQVNYAFFPEDTYIMKGRPNDKTVMKHFTGPRRHEFYAYGIALSEK